MTLNCQESVNKRACFCTHIKYLAMVHKFFVVSIGQQKFQIEQDKEANKNVSVALKVGMSDTRLHLKLDRNIIESLYLMKPQYIDLLIL